MTASSRKSFTALIFLLPFLAGGARGLGLLPNLEPRQIFTPTTESSPLPSQSPIIIINDFRTSLDTCTLHNVTWTYAGPPLPLSLTATNLGVPQEGPPLSTSLRPTPTLSAVRVRAVPSGASGVGITTEIVEGADPRGAGVPWNVNIPQGWYQVVATIGSAYAGQSQPFYVQTGSDQSCLITIPSPSPSSASTLPSSTLGQTTTPAPLPSSPSPPASKDSRIGVIVGVVAGAIVFMILILMAYLCLRRRKNTLDRPVSGQTGGAQLTRGWGGLGSRDSIHVRKAPATRNTGHRSTMDSVGPLYTAEDQRSSNFSPFEEKFGTSPVSYTQDPFDDAEGGLALATLPSSGDRATSSRSSVQLGQLPPSQQHSSTTVDTSYQYEQGYTQRRSPSIDASPHSSMQPSYSHLSSPLAAKDVARSYSSSTGGASSADANHQQKKNAHRQSGGVQARKTPRKPVPAYDPSIPSTISTSITTITSSSSPSPATPISASVASSSHGHYAKKSHRAATEAESSNELLHKSSFGPGGVEGKPVHYLIPDMPQSKGI